MKARLFLVVYLANLGVSQVALAQGPPPSPVRMAQVVSEEVAEYRMVTGELRSQRVTEVASQEPGLVVELLFEVGMHVEAGQVLATLDSERLELRKRWTTAERSSAESVIAEAEASYQRWEAEVESLQDAAELGASTARELRDASVEFRRAVARFEKARRDLEIFDARLSLLQRRLQDMQIVAPFAGTITQKLSESGGWLSEGDSVCELVHTDELEFTLDVPQQYLPVLAALVRNGGMDSTNLIVGLDAAESPLTVENVRVVPVVDERSRSFQLVGRVRNTEGALAAGQSIVGWVPTGTSGEHLIVPTDAVLRNNMGPFVYVARQSDEGPATAMPATIEVLFEMPGRVVVEAAGLQPGDLIVTEGNDRLYPTAPVRPIGDGGRDANAEPKSGQAEPSGAG